MLTDALHKPFYETKTSIKNSIHYQSRVVRSVEPIQPELSKALNQLKETTGNFVEYKPIGRLGITLAILDPALKQVVGADKKGQVSDETIKHFEAELNEELDFANQGLEYPLKNPNVPVDLYGSEQARLGITLSQRDLRLRGQRLIVEEYIKDTYPAVSRRFGSKDLAHIVPHVTIGTVIPAYLDKEDRDLLYKDPSDFMLGRVLQEQIHAAERYRLDQPEPIVFPEAICLGGLHVVCEQR